MNSETPANPLLAVNKDELIAMRRRLEEVFTELSLVLGVTSICSAAAACQGSDVDPDIATVLRRCASDIIYQQMQKLTPIIEQLGGETELSGDEETPT